MEHTNEAEAEKFIKEQEQQPKPSLGNINNNGGQPEQVKQEIGWKNIPIDNLPTGGRYYPAGVRILIRAANVQEIRHWSTIDENDGYSIDDLLNYIIERCAQISFPNLRASYKDLKELDRFYLIFAIRELTFKNGENKLITTVTSKNGTVEKIEVVKDIITYFELSDRLKKFYDETEKCFIFKTSSGEIIKTYVPSLGITSQLKKFREERSNGQELLDKDFEKYALFLFSDWRKMTIDELRNMQQESFNWSLQKISILSNFVDEIKKCINPSIKTEIPGDGEVTIPLDFQGGLKAIFVIPNILDELI
jgi:hypothetical protein